MTGPFPGGGRPIRPGSLVLRDQWTERVFQHPTPSGSPNLVAREAAVKNRVSNPASYAATPSQWTDGFFQYPQAHRKPICALYARNCNCSLLLEAKQLGDSGHPIHGHPASYVPKGCSLEQPFPPHTFPVRQLLTGCPTEKVPCFGVASNSHMDTICCVNVNRLQALEIPCRINARSIR